MSHLKLKIEKLLNFLNKKYENRRKLRDPYRVLISTILSQRTKDEVTESASKRLFLKYKTSQEIANASIEELEILIKPVGFYHIKAKRIIAISKIIIKECGGEVPSNIDKLCKFEGVGRKTANCVLAFGFGIPALPVDTHVHRISNRLGLVTTKSPQETEKSLKEIIPKQWWGTLNSSLVKFGKEICKPRNPNCRYCEIRNMCKYSSKHFPLPFHTLPTKSQ